MSRVVVTGGSGFIGSHVMRALSEGGHQAVNVDRADKFRACEIGGHDLDPLESLLPGAEAVIHCAAKADVRHNWDDGEVERLVDENIVSTVYLLEAMRRISTIRTLVFVSTGAVYSNQTSPYAASKISGESWCKAYAAKCGWRLVIVRPAACYGLGYHHGHIADFVRMATATGRVTSLTKGAPRDGLHVEDCAGWLAKFATDNLSAHFGTFYLRANGRQWGCRDTVRLMGVEADWSDEVLGWAGDTAVSMPSDAPCGRALESGVRTSLMSLGWVTK